MNIIYKLSENTLFMVKLVLILYKRQFLYISLYLDTFINLQKLKHLFFNSNVYIMLECLSRFNRFGGITYENRCYQTPYFRS